MTRAEVIKAMSTEDLARFMASIVADAYEQCGNPLSEEDLRLMEIDAYKYLVQPTAEYMGVIS